MNAPSGQGPIPPLVTNIFSAPGGLSFTASCFPGEDWSLKPLQKPGDEAKDPLLTARIASALHGLGAQRAYAPTPTAFNGRIVPARMLTDAIPLPHDIALHRKPEIPADGTFLERQYDAGIFSAGGCGVIVATNGRKLLFAHAGRDCLLDRQWVISEGGSRDRPTDLAESIVNALEFDSTNELRDCSIWLLYFIHPNDYRHDANSDKYGAYNRGAISFLPRKFGDACGTVTDNCINLNLPGIARQQFLNLGVPSKNIDYSQCYLDDSLPTTRSGDGTGRYLTAIVRG